MAQSFFAANKLDSSLHYARLSIESPKIGSQKLTVLEAAKLLVKIYRNQRVADSIIYYQDLTIAMNDSLYGPAKLKQVQVLALSEQQKFVIELPIK